MKNVFVLAFCMCLLQTIAAADGQEFVENDKASISYFEANELNFDAVRKGDVLIRINSETDAAKKKDGRVSGAIFHSEEWIRLSFDFDQKLIACYRVQTDKLVNFNRIDLQGAPSDTKQVAWSGIVVNGIKDQFKSNSSDSPARGGKPSFEFAKNNINASRFLRDFRGIWLEGNCNYNSYDRIKKKLRLYSASPEKFKFRRSGKTSSVKLKMKLNASKSYDGERRYVFDNKSLMLTAFKSTIILSEKKNPALLTDWRIEWQAIDEIYLPSLLSSRGTASVRSHDLEEQILGGKKTEMKFHWFSVNEEIARKEIDMTLHGESRIDFESIQLNVDPITNGADSIVSDLKSFSIESAKEQAQDTQNKQ